VKETFWKSKTVIKRIPKNQGHELQPQQPFQQGQRSDRSSESKKEKSMTKKQNGYKCIQIEATVHFDPELLSREILER